MPTDIGKLQSLVTEATGEIATRYADNPARFVREMEAVIVRAHTAATIGAIQDRTGVRPAGLSRAERADLQAAIAAQRPYLTGFAEDIRKGNLTPEQIQRRAELYAGPVRATYYTTRTYGYDMGNVPIPADGNTSCKAWCRCVAHIETQGDETVWVYNLTAAEHCPECVTRAARSPYSLTRVVA